MNTAVKQAEETTGEANKEPLKIATGRTRVTPIRLTPEEYSEFVEASKKLGLTPSDFIRTAGLNALVGGVSTDRERTNEIKKVHAELGKQGALLNQIARVLNLAKKKIAENKDEEKRLALVEEMLDACDGIRDDLIEIRRVSADLAKGRN